MDRGSIIVRTFAVAESLNPFVAPEEKDAMASNFL
jgi:hypothetical protein